MWESNKEKKSISVQPSTPPKIVIGGYNLPRPMDLFDWGDVHFLPGEEVAIVFKSRSKGIYNVKINKQTYHVELKYKDRVVVEFQDELLNTGDLSDFKRIINNYTYYFKDGEVVYKEFTYKKNYIPKLGRRINYNREKDFKVITMDLETRCINGVISPYACSIYDGKEFKFFYISEYGNSDALLKACIIYLMKKKYNKYTVYWHNFSKFYGIFLVKVLTDLSNKVNIIMRDSNILNVVFHDGKKKLHFKDSYLMLPTSLSKLAKQFMVEDKGIFPYKFVDTINLDYYGPVPEFKYFEGINEYQYKQYVFDYTGKTWNLRKETEWYCNQDCLVLYRVLNHFTEEVFKLFNILVINYATLSSLAFAIYRSNFMKENKICTLDGRLYLYGKEYYRGGFVDVFTKILELIMLTNYILTLWGIYLCQLDSLHLL
uniref:DNA polymerase n=1 Tax=Daedaleopsis nitida TaxID=1140402 RepID=UPI0030E2B40F